MPSATTIVVTDPLGERLFETAQFLEAGDNPGLRYVLSCGLVGACVATLPPEFNDRLPKDGRIHIMRSVNGGPAQREGGSCFLIRKWQYADNYTTVTALHANHLMWRRHVLYTYFDAQIEQGEADEMIRDFFRHNNITDGLITPSRKGGTTGFDLSSYLSIVEDDFTSSTTAKRAGWMDVGDVIREVSDDATFAGDYLAAEIIAPTESTLAFKTYLDVRGADRRFSTGSGLVFSEARGNLANALLTVDATEEKTVALAGGPSRDFVDGQQQYAEDTARIAESPFGRIETFVDSQATDATSLLNDAGAALRASRPVISATAEIQETDRCIRGINFDYGDLVTVEVQGIQYDMRLDVLEVTLQGGVETTRASFYYDDR